LSGIGNSITGTIRVVGFKLSQHLFLFFSFSFSSLVFLLVSTEEHLLGLIDQAIFSFILMYGFHFVAGNAIFTYLINAGFLLFLLSIKGFLAVSMIVGNLIEVYLFGVIAVLVYHLLLLYTIGFVLLGAFLYLFLTDFEVFLVLLFLLELFSSVFQSVTLANRLSVNLIAGALLTELILLLLLILGKDKSCLIPFILLFLFSLYTFELINCYIQVFIFSLLSLEHAI
jgi:hypothetical protein